MKTTRIVTATTLCTVLWGMPLTLSYAQTTTDPATSLPPPPTAIETTDMTTTRDRNIEWGWLGLVGLVGLLGLRHAERRSESKRTTSYAGGTATHT